MKNSEVISFLHKLNEDDIDGLSFIQIHDAIKNEIKNAEKIGNTNYIEVLEKALVMFNNNFTFEIDSEESLNQDNLLYAEIMSLYKKIVENYFKRISV
jgi:hypothetical protein